jgi:lipopolysaccharide biosynthesis glycosyltransferase
MGVVITSAVLNAAESTAYDFHCLVASDVAQEERSQIAQFLDGTRHTVRFVEMGGAYSDVSIAHPRVTTPTLYKLRIPELLGDCDRAIYLDTDVLVLEDLQEMFSLDMQGNYLMGIPDMFWQIWHRLEAVKMGITEIDFYINAGVMLMDLALLRKDGITRKLEASIGKFPTDKSVDQMLWNSVCSEQVEFLPLKYNVVFHWMRAGAANIFWMPLEIEEANGSPAVFHFTAKDKPWRHYDLPLAHLWFQYYDLSPFKEVPLHRISVADAKFQKTLEFALKQKHVLIYGAGKRGMYLFDLFRVASVPVDGFVVSDGQKTAPDIEGVPVYELSEIPYGKEETSLILALKNEFLNQALPSLLESGIKTWHICPAEPGKK